MSKIINAAIQHLSDLGCSEHELRIYLKSKFANLPNLDSRINAVFKRLHELKLLNDLRLASNLAQHYAHKGDRFIIQMLKQKGITEQIISQVLDLLEKENIRALDAAREKLSTNISHTNSTNLLYRFLSGRSFSPASIQTVVGTLHVRNQI